MMEERRKHWNRKGLQFRNAFFAVLIIGMVVTAFGIIINEWNTYYQSGLSYNLGGLDRSSEISTTIEGYQTKVSPSSPDIGNDYQSNTLQAVYGVITNLMTPFSVVFGDNGMIDAIASMVGLPDYVTKTIVTMMVLAVVFAVIAIVFRLWKTTT